jgi:hypothetical protein
VAAGAPGPKDATGPVQLDILDSQGTVIRSYSSDDPVIDPDPALHTAAYDEICRKDPTAPNCNVPLYWPAPQRVLSTKMGMHRFAWDLHYEPIGPEPREASAEGAVPHHTYPSVNTPWAPPGEYTVRLIVNGRQLTQPLSLRLDPRVKTPAADLARVATLSREMYDDAVASHAAYEEARKLLSGEGAPAKLGAADRKALEAIAPEPRPRPRFFFFRPAPSGPPTLNGVSDELLRAAMSMQRAETAATEREVAACDAARKRFEAVMETWKGLRARAGS